MVEIERAAPADFAAIAALDRAAWRHDRAGQFIPDGEHVWRIWCEHALAFVARLDAAVVAAAVAFPCADGRWCLHKIMVAEPHRGRGIARRLLGAVVEELDRRGAEAFLTVDPTNERALALYGGFGFTGRRFVAGYYRHCEDRLVLTRPKAAQGTDREG